jgi:hypothetical protein
MDTNGNPNPASPTTGPNAPPPPAAPFQWEWLKDLQLPPELVKEAEVRLRKHGFFARFSKKWRCYVEEELKLQHFYGGQTIAFLDTPEGGVIVAKGPLESEEFDRGWNNLSREQQCNSIIYAPNPLNDPESRLSSVYYLNED